MHVLVFTARAHRAGLATCKARPRTNAVALLAAACLVACASSAEEGPVASVASADTVPTVADKVSSGCSTTAVWGLATQLVEELECMQPGLFGRIDGDPNITLNAAAFPFMQKPAAEALRKAAALQSGKLTINSSLRTLPQQYLLYQWYKAGQCGITLASAPGGGNHQQGLAVDVQDNATWRASLESQGYKWLGAGDVVHFDYKAGGTNIAGGSALAFQRLWNRNNPNDKIAEDGDYGPQTEARLLKSPSVGFAQGAICKNTTVGPPPIPVDEGPEAKAPESSEGDPADTHVTEDASGVASQPGGCATSPQTGGKTGWAVFALLGLVIARRRVSVKK